MFASGSGDWAVVAFPVGAVVGTVLGGAVGAGTGYVFAPPAWTSVPITRAP
jgi:outer membrane lipoprotein SlyB